MTNISASVVIPAHNASKTISQTLQAVLDQKVRFREIIVVDDGSTDDTHALIKKFNGVQYIYQDNAGPALARNAGAGKASGEILIFTDSDCVPEKAWSEHILSHFDDETVAVVMGSYGIANAESLLARCIHREIMYRHHTLMPKYPKAFGSYNFGIRKKIFDQLGGFNSVYRSASGEDNDLSYRVIHAGYKIYFAGESVVSHYHPTKMGQYLKEQFRHGFWRVKMYVDHPDMAKGDDYTFWKDIGEIPLAMAVVVCGLLTGLSKAVFWGTGIFLVLTLFVIQLIFSLVITKNIFEVIFYAFVLFFRSFARLFGFSSGFLRFFVFKKPKKNK